MAITLTPEQEAALQQFDADADAANDTRTQSTQADADAITAQANADHLKQASVETMAKALESAQAFLNSMLPNRASSPPGLAAKGAKK